MVAFSTIKPGDVLYDCHRTKMGNTTMSRMGTWTVHIISIDTERRMAMVSWNGNMPSRWTERQISKLRRSKPATKTI
jgi:hypothetical protein